MRQITKDIEITIDGSRTGFRLSKTRRLFRRDAASAAYAAGKLAPVSS